jgi:hypothetical protein
MTISSNDLTITRSVYHMPTYYAFDYVFKTALKANLRIILQNYFCLFFLFIVTFSKYAAHRSKISTPLFEPDLCVRLLLSVMRLKEKNKTQ